MLKTAQVLILLITLSSCISTELKKPSADWFESIKNNNDKTDLYRFLHDMPKGGDLHNHLSGAGFSEWWFDLAIAEQVRGYKYYTRIGSNSCGDNSDQKTIILFQNISKINYSKLPPCIKQQYKELSDLSVDEKNQWLNAIRLDKPNEGRDEFFGSHWQRLNAINKNPWLKAELLFKNMQAFGREGLSYVEFQLSVDDFVKPDGAKFIDSEVAEIYRKRLRQKDALDTGVTVRFQSDLLRFLPKAEQTLAYNYQFADENKDLWVAVNMVGREDNPLGNPKRFASTMKKMQKRFPNVRASIHAGESEFADSNIRDTLAMGADRIGHGVNLIYDKKTMESMRHGEHLVEINLISNLLLGYVKDYDSHPFPHYLRTGIPVTLSTDDRGMWDSTMTDE
ncbi:MAG: hypothetical protein L3J46_05220 [Kangiellaceae bacterium]|nr:hypothetical protein [Kangiellaceae bacterium]